MQNKIVILGSGTCTPSLARGSCSLVMKTGGLNLLFDCGPGTMRRLLEAGISIFDVSCLFLSHFHPDHSGELASFLFSLKYSHQPDSRLPLTLVAGKGINAFINGLQRLYEPFLAFPDDLLNIVELDTAKEDNHTFESFTAASMPVNHRPESLAFRIDDAGGNRFVYSGDTDICEGLKTFAADADLMVCESAMPDEMKIDGHLTPSLAGQIAQAAGVKCLILTHFYPECETVDIEKQCRSAYNGRILLARDLMTVPL